MIPVPSRQNESLIFLEEDREQPKTKVRDNRVCLAWDDSPDGYNRMIDAINDISESQSLRVYETGGNARYYEVVFGSKEEAATFVMFYKGQLAKP